MKASPARSVLVYSRMFAQWWSWLRICSQNASWPLSSFWLFAILYYPRDVARTVLPTSCVKACLGLLSWETSPLSGAYSPHSFLKPTFMWLPASCNTSHLTYGEPWCSLLLQRGRWFVISFFLRHSKKVKIFVCVWKINAINLSIESNFITISRSLEAAMSLCSFW